MKTFIYIVIIVVVVAIVAGFFIVDSPKESRLKKFDEQRVNNLSFLQSEILNYWQRKGELPKSLDDLRDDIRGIVIPVDPENNEKYGYETKEKLMFSLCANFKTNNVGVSKPLNKPISPSDMPYRPIIMHQYDYPDWWGHGVGHVCFERKIDPELYPPIKK